MCRRLSPDCLENLLIINKLHKFSALTTWLGPPVRLIGRSVQTVWLIPVRLNSRVVCLRNVVVTSQSVFPPLRRHAVLPVRLPEHQNGTAAKVFALPGMPEWPL